MVIGVTAAADEGAVADAAGGFVQGASGGGAGGEVAVLVESYGSYGVVAIEAGLRRGFREVAAFCVVVRLICLVNLFGWCFRTFVVMSKNAAEGDVGKAGREAGLGFFEADALAVEDEFGVVE